MHLSPPYMRHLGAQEGGCWFSALEAVMDSVIHELNHLPVFTRLQVVRTDVP
jgi:hypothetical protein